MTKRLPQNLIDIAQNDAQQDGIRALQFAHEALTRAAAEVERYIERYELAETDDDRVRLLTRALGFVPQVMTNARLDLIGDAIDTIREAGALVADE